MAPVILQQFPSEIVDYAEPFTGGGSVALEVAERFPDADISLNDADWWVSSFWSTVIGEQWEFDRLVEFSKIEPTIGEFNRRRKRFCPEVYAQRFFLCPDPVEAACNTLFFNRTTFSGILSSGPIGGKDQGGKLNVAVRWPTSLPDDLRKAREILEGRTTCECTDFVSFSEAHPDSFLYCDPPYFKAGGALYGPPINDLHDRLFKLLAKRGNWLLSYDPDGAKLYKGFPMDSLDHYRSMSNRKVRPRDASEYLIKPKV